MRKILTAQTREDINYMLESGGLFPGDQKGCRKETRRADDQLYIGQYILKDVNTRKKYSHDWDRLQKGIWHGRRYGW